jgi:diacylglycerol kinase (ATP)
VEGDKEILRAFVLLNPGASRYNCAAIRAALEEHLSRVGWTIEVLEMSPGVDTAEVVHKALGLGLDVLVAAGGDGTVAIAATALVGTETSLAILPLGTGNILAREIGIPMQLEPALALLTGPHMTRAIDAMQVGDRVFVVAVGAGFSGRLMRETPYQAKRRLGRLSYVWTGIRRLFGLEFARFDIEVDGRVSWVRASEVEVANVGIAGDRRLRWGSHVRLDDGRLDVCIIRGRNGLDYLLLVTAALLRQHKRDPNLYYLTAERSVTIRSRSPLPVQGDGDFIGQTPVHIELLPAALQVIVPLPDKSAPAGGGESS